MPSAGLPLKESPSATDAIYVQTGGLIVSRPDGELSGLTFSNTYSRSLVYFTPNQLVDLIHFFERNKSTTRTTTNHVPDLATWGDDFRYMCGSLRQQCSKCHHVWLEPQREHHECPTCGASHKDIESELCYENGITIKTRKHVRKGFNLYPCGTEGYCSGVQVCEFDLDEVLSALHALLGIPLTQINKQRGGEMNNLKHLLESALSSMIMIIVMVGYFGNFPIALIWGDKWDVVISLFVPFYGIWILIREFLLS